MKKAHKANIKKTRSCLHAHARQRSNERFGLYLNKAALKRIIVAIQSNDSTLATFVERQSLNRTVWRVLVEDEWLTVVYDKLRKGVVTVLPRECRENRKWKVEQVENVVKRAVLRKLERIIAHVPDEVVQLDFPRSNSPYQMTYKIMTLLRSQLSVKRA